MGEMCQGLKDLNTSGSVTRGNGSSHHHQVNNSRSDIESQGRPKLYKLEGWRHILFHSNRSSCCQLNNTGLSTRETEPSFKVALTN